MSIQISLCPQPHNAMNFWDMTWDKVRFPGAGTMFVSARKAVFSAPVIWVGVWPASRLRAFTKSKWAEMPLDRKSTRLNSSHLVISYAVFCLKKKKKESHE